MKRLDIDGKNFSTYEGFANNLSEQILPSSNYIGLSQLDDVLYGGMGGFDEGEKIRIIWHNSQKSKKDLGNRYYIKTLKAQRRHMKKNGAKSLTNEEAQAWLVTYDREINTVKKTNL